MVIKERDSMEREKPKASLVIPYHDAPRIDGTSV